MKVFEDYAYYYNVFYQDKDYKAETVQIDKLLRKYGKEVNRVIHYGCGTGKHDIELAKGGYRCDGIDMSPQMIAIAVENAEKEDLKINFSIADVRYFEPKEKYDAVISMFHVMSYQNTNQDITAAFRSARKALNAGGIFLFDVWYGPGVLSDKPAVRVKEVEEGNNKLVRIARPVMHDKKNVVDVCYEIFVIDQETMKTKIINEIHHMRYFFRPELELMLKEAGFEMLDNLDCKSLETTNYNSWTSYVIARAN